MATLVVHHVNTASIIPTYTAANIRGDRFYNDGKTILHLKNAGTQKTVTIPSALPCNRHYQHEVSFIIPATTGDVMIGPFPIDRYNDRDGYCQITYSGVSGLTIAVVALSGRLIEILTEAGMVEIPSEWSLAARYGLVSAWGLGDLSDSYGIATLTNNGGATFNTGKLGDAVYLDRTVPQWLSVADTPALSCGDNDFLFAQWVYLADATFSVLSTKTTGAQTEYELGFPSSGNFYWYVENAGANAQVDATTFGAPGTGVWRLVIGVHDSVNDLISISVDGGDWDSAALAGGARDTTGDVLFGRTVAGSPFSGRLDAAYFFKSPPGGIAALQDEIRDFLWNDGLGQEYPNNRPSTGGLTARSVYNTRDYPAEIVTVPAPDEAPELGSYVEFGGGNHVDGSTYDVAVTYAGWSDAGSASETMLGPATSTVCENGNTLSVLPLAPLETRAVGAWIYIRKDGGAWHRSGSASNNQDKIIGFGDDGLYGGVLFDFRAAGAAPPGSNTAVDSNGDPIDDPLLAPAVTRIAGVDLTTYYAAYSYVGGDLAETALSPTSDPITVTDRGSAIYLRLPELTPSGVCFVNLYLSADGATWHKQGASQPWDYVVHSIWMYDSSGAAPSPGTPQSTLHEIQLAWDAAVEDGGGIVEFNPTSYPSDLLSPLHFRGRTAAGVRVDGVHLISHGGHSTNPIANGRLVYAGPAGVTALGASASNCIIEGLDLVDPDGLVKTGLVVFDPTGGGGFNQAWIDCHFAALASGGIGFAVLNQHQSASTHSASGITFDRCTFQADAWGVDQCGSQTLNNQFRDSDTRTSGNGGSANSGDFRFWDAPARVKVPSLASNGQYVFYVSDQVGGRADLDLDYIYIEAKHAIQAFYLSARATSSPRLTLRESYLVNQTGEVNLLIYAGGQNEIVLEHNVALAGDIQFGDTGRLILFGPDGNPVARQIGHPTAGYQPLDLGYSAPPAVAADATDPASVIALANDLKAKLKALGLIV